MNAWIKTFLSAAIGVLAATHAASQAQDAFPTKPVQMVVPVGGGGSTDVMLRGLAALVEPHLGQKIVILNRPGASGMLGVGSLARSAADGYTIGGVWSGPVTMAPHIESPGYTFDDFVVVAAVTVAPGVFCVKPDFPASNGKEFIEELRRNPGKYTYGNEGIGGFVHLAGERIFAQAGVKAVAVPFQGANQTATAFLGGHIDIFGGGIPSILQHAGEGRAKCLLVTASARHPTLPKTDSLSDVGLAEAETLLWRAVIAPKGVPSDRLAKLQTAIQDAVRTPDFKKFAESRGETPWLLDFESVNRYAQNENRTMLELVNRLGLKK